MGPGPLRASTPAPRRSRWPARMGGARRARVGKQEGGLTYVRIPGQPALYAIESKALGELPATPEELLL